uniref:Cadherin domain-containing protein n=1 Tax=Xiphophorus couchianus TaxID=32473 RepID=A0A3B5MM14_9TELE
MLVTDEVLDRELQSEYNITVTATDSGSPSLSSVKVITILVNDVNDNPPTFTHSQYNVNILENQPMAPKGYLITKVVAVDPDSGHNAWLSYRIIKATRSNLFMADLHTGEIRTLRTFMDEDETKHTIVVLVTDNGRESLSATATVSIRLSDGLPVLSELYEFVEETKDNANDNLTLYLIIALSTVSFLFILLISGVFYFNLCRRSYVYRSNTSSLPVFPTTYCTSTLNDFSRCGTLLRDDRYDPFMTTGSWRGDFRFGSNTDTDTLKKRSAAYQKNTLRRLSADRPSLKVRAGPTHPCYVIK